MALIRLLVFSSAGVRLALDLRDVARVLPAPALGKAAGAPAFVAGYFNYRGQAVAVVRLDRLLGGTDDALGLYAPLILLADQAPPLALHVARIDGVVATEADKIQPIDGAETFNGCVRGQLTDADGSAYLIRADALFLSVERARLAAFAALQQARIEALTETGHAA